jgi:Fungal specific transcription factor domain
MIERTQRAHVDENTGTESEWKRTPVGTLAPQLYIYHVRMFPVWPVVNVDNLIAQLQQEDQDSHDALEAYALATSVVAATVAQLRLEHEHKERENIRASDMVLECEKACSLIGSRNRINLNTVRIFFFLHIYYENQQPGSGESLLRLRESISVAQLMSLHREISYTGRTAEEQNLRRWTLWLLFVTERGVCLLHKLPVIIKTSIALPSLNSHVDGPLVLPAFVQLINLFWTFELFGLFDVVGDTAGSSLDLQTMEALHRKLHDVVKDLDSVSDVQKVDIYVTRHWMEMILWKLRSPLSLSSNDMSVAFPFNAALDFLNTVDRVPKSAIEAHGLTIVSSICLSVCLDERNSSNL